MAFNEQKISNVLNNFLQIQGYTDVKANFVSVSDSRVRRDYSWWSY